MWTHTTSSPKLRPKNRKAAADATAYDQVAILDNVLCAEARELDKEGRPTRKNARPKKTHGADNTYTDGFILKRGYQTAEAVRNTLPKT